MPSQSLMPNRTERVNRVRGDLAMGIPCLLTDGSGTALLVPLETVTEDRFAALQADFGVPDLVISASRARAVMTAAAAANLGAGPVRIRPPEAADFAWYQRVIDTKFDHGSGAVGPLHVLRAGEMPFHKAGLAIVKSAELIPAFALFMLARNSAALAGLPLMSLDATDALEELASRPVLAPIAAAQLPLEVHDVSRLHIFRDPDGQREHYAIEIGSPDLTKPVLTRLHSACFTGDVLGSLKCDCGPQLRASLARMSEEGAGVLVYLNQEGRGIGLANKMRVYDLQSKGLDTVEANHQLGFEDDERDFRLAAEVLQKLGITSIRLLTNNPYKERSLAESGITVTERLPLRVGKTMHNQAYLSIKALKSGHIL